MSSLTLDNVNSLHQQKQKQQAESRNTTAQPVQASKHTPLAAPQPTRAPSASQAQGMWAPEMGIRFGGNGASPEKAAIGAKAKDNKWDPTKGLKFS